MKRRGEGPQSFGLVSEFIPCFWPTTVSAEGTQLYCRRRMKLANRHVANMELRNVYGFGGEKLRDIT